MTGAEGSPPDLELCPVDYETACTWIEDDERRHAAYVEAMEAAAQEASDDE